MIGYAISLIGGGYFAWLFLGFMRSKWMLGPKPETDADRIWPWLTGVVERSAFTTLIVIGLSDIGTMMMAWLGLKLATNWNHPDFRNDPRARSHAFAALLAGLISMAFAYAGGVYASYGWLWPMS